MTICRIEDNSLIPTETLEHIPKLVHKILDKSLAQLENEGLFIFPTSLQNSLDLDGDQVVLQRSKDGYHTSNVMGFLAYQEEQLAIGSRFSTDKEDYFVHYMLARVLKSPNILELPTGMDRGNPSYSLLPFLFSHYLKIALRKGLFKTYVTNEYNDSHVKGTIAVARHIRVNTPFLGKVAYDQSMFSYDNNLMELIRHTIECRWIKKQPYSTQLLQSIRTEVQSVTEATPSYRPFDRERVVLENQKHLIQHAYYSEYRALQKLCLLILQCEQYQIHPGKKPTQGILFDGAWLWEEYVDTLIAPMFYHPRNKAQKGRQLLFSGNVGQIYPDFISRDPVNRIIADAKYRPIENIGNRDYLQVLAYMFRFDAKKGFYLYPETRDQANLVLKMNHGSTYEANVAPREDIQIIKCGLRVPKNYKHYSEFVADMETSEVEFLKNFEVRDA